MSLSSTLIITYKSPGVLPLNPDSPSLEILSLLPVSTPAGTLMFKLCLCIILPEPSHCLHFLDIVLPSPLQTLHVFICWKVPKGVLLLILTCPAPLHSSHAFNLPSSLPAPLHLLHSLNFSNSIFFVVPFADSSKLILNS